MFTLRIRGDQLSEPSRSDVTAECLPFELRNFQQFTVLERGLMRHDAGDD
jgi:hypothetical protein